LKWVAKCREYKIRQGVLSRTHKAYSPVEKANLVSLMFGLDAINL
jgi:hypothetical protein